MAETEANGSETLASVLVRRARQASDGRLVLDAVSGLVVGALALAFRPPAWPVVLSAAVSILAFGTWGISDRALREAEAGSRGAHALRALCVATAALGALGVVALAATTMAFMLGTWIS
jgi:hypothetical protein